MTPQVGQEDTFVKTTTPDVVDGPRFKGKNVDRSCPDVDEIHLRSVWNSLTPINSLPHELLASVFKLALFSTTKLAHKNLPDKLTQICRQWRFVAIADPSLWSDIRISGKQCGAAKRTLMYLTRSQMLPIFVQFGALRYRHHWLQIQEWSTLLNPHSLRIREFILETQEVAPVLENLTLPNLENLEIQKTGHKGIPTPFPDFHGELPRLRHLSMAHFTSWPPTLFQNLVTLRLSHRDTDSDENVKMSTFVDLLEASPLLERLQVFHHGPIDDGTASGRVVTLPQLVDLNLNTCHSRAILAHIQLPPFVKVTIRDSLFFLLRLDEEEFRGDRIDLTLAIAEDLEIDYLHLFVGFWLAFMKATNRMGLCMEVSEDLICFCDSGESELPHLTLNSIIANGMFTSVTTLVVDIMVVIDNVAPVQVWRDILRQFSSLEHLAVTGPSTLLKVLRSDVANDTLICPTLRKLVLTTNLGDDPKLWFANLSLILEHRRNRGYPIHDLELDLACSKNVLPLDYIEGRRAALKDLGLKRMSFCEKPDGYRGVR